MVLCMDNFLGIYRSNLLNSFRPIRIPIRVGSCLRHGVPLRSGPVGERRVVHQLQLHGVRDQGSGLTERVSTNDGFFGKRVYVEVAQTQFAIRTNLKLASNAMDRH